MAEQYHFVATCTRGAEQALRDELFHEIEPEKIRIERGAVAFLGEMEDGLRACLWSRVASRVLLVIDTFPVPSVQALYDGVRDIRWLDHLGPANSLAVDFVGTTAEIRNSRFGALKVKDAVVDRIRTQRGDRPRVDLRSPDVRINVHVRNGEATVSIDLSGDSLHRRGYRADSGPAPLKENLAAALLRIADWPVLALEGVPLYDPMCGSGTLLIEAAGMALDVAPGLGRKLWGHTNWRGNRHGTWTRLVEEAHHRRRAAVDRKIEIHGSDQDRRVLGTARENAKLAHVPVRLKCRELQQIEPPESAWEGSPRGLIVTNPPYGDRLGVDEEIAALYRGMGDVFRRRFLGWRVWILAGSPKLSKRFGLKASERVEIHNGPIDCRYVRLDISERAVEGRGPGWQTEGASPKPVE